MKILDDFNEDHTEIQLHKVEAMVRLKKQSAVIDPENAPRYNKEQAEVRDVMNSCGGSTREDGSINGAI